MRFAPLYIILTTAAHYHITKKCFACSSVICLGMGIETSGDSCELAQACPSPPPCQPHRANLLCSHPPHFALLCHSATPPPPQSIEMRRLALTLHHVFKLSGLCPVWDKGAAKNQSKAASLIGHTGNSNIHPTPIVMSRVSSRLRMYCNEPTTSRASKMPLDTMPPLAAPLKPWLRKS
jgi:hypothetical protein